MAYAVVGKRRVVASLWNEARAEFWKRELTEAGFDIELGKSGHLYRLTAPEDQQPDARDYKRGFESACRMLSDLKAYTRGLLRGIEVIEGRDLELMRRAGLAGLVDLKEV